MEKDTGNFSLWFPNQSYRKWKRHKEEPGKSIVKDLDKLLKETNFDLKKFEELYTAWQDNKMKAIELTHNNNGIPNEKAKNYNEIGQKYCDEVQKMLMPYYNNMVELGYDEHDLAG